MAVDSSRGQCKVMDPPRARLGISINSACERESYASGAGPSCCPAYRDTPWAAVLTDMGTYSLDPGQVGLGRIVDLLYRSSTL